MKKIMFLLFAMATLTLAAEPLCLIENGKFTRKGYWLRELQNAVESADGVTFNGKDTAVWIKLNKFAENIQEFSIVANIVVDELPAKGTAAIVNRPGYHNLFGVDNLGRIHYSIYGADKATRQVLYSKTKVKAGDKIQIASVIEKVDEEEFDIILYINGVEESRKTMYRAIFPYNRDNFHIGSLSMKIQPGTLFCGKIINMYVAEEALDEDTIVGLK